MKNKYILTLIFLISVSGCNIIKTKPVDLESIKVGPDSSDIQACLKSSPLTTGTFEEIVLKLNENVSLLNSCSDKHKNLVDYIKKNLEDKK